CHGTFSSKAVQWGRPQALVPQVHVPDAHLPAVQLSASIADIFTFPALRQFVLNRIDDIATLGVGFAGSAAGLGQSIAPLPTPDTTESKTTDKKTAAAHATDNPGTQSSKSNTGTK